MRVRFTYEPTNPQVCEVELVDDLESVEDFRDFVLDAAPYFEARAIDFEILD